MRANKVGVRVGEGMGVYVLAGGMLRKKEKRLATLPLPNHCAYTFSGKKPWNPGC